MLKNSLLLFASMVVVILGLEFVVRGFDLFAAERLRSRCPPEDVGREGAEDENRKAAEEPALGMLIHPYTGWTRRPGAEVYRCQRWPAIFGDGEPTSWFLEHSVSNAFGFNSAIDDYRDISEEDLAIGMFGGSIANDLSVIGGDALVRRLEERLPGFRGRVQLLNFAAAAYKQPQQLFTLSQALLLEVPLDVVVNVDGFNEVALGLRAASQGIHPLFPTESQYDARVRWAMGEPSPEALAIAAETLASEKRIESRLALLDAVPGLSRLEAVRALIGQSVLREDEKRRHLRARLHRTVSEAKSMTTANLSDPCLETPDDCLPAIARLWRNASLAMHASSHQAGARYLHVLQPNQYLQGMKPLNPEELETAFLETSTWAEVAKGYPLLLGEIPALEEAGIAFADLTRIFANREDTIYRDTCCHYNWLGNQILGEAVGDLVADLVAEGTEVEHSPRSSP